MGDYKEIIHIEKEQNNILLVLGMLAFAIGTFTINTFISSIKIEALFLILSIFLFITYYIIQNKGLIIYKLEIMWLLFFIYIIFNFLYQGNYSRGYNLDILVFFMLFLFLVLVKLNINYYKIAMNTMLVIAIVYAFSIFLQYFNIDLYTKLILPRFDTSVQERILELYRRNAYTGFTAQTAYAAGYLVYGIGVLLFLFKEKTSILNRRLLIVALPLLFFALLLTGTRSHLLFLILALVLTYLFSTKLKHFFLQISKLVFSLFMTIVVGIFLFKVFTPDKDTLLIGPIYVKFSEAIEGIDSAEELTSGRTLLYEYAFKLFNETPIFGIGWKEYSQLSGFILNNEGSHPHNIYFQLLTEWGLLGFVLFLIPVIYLLFKTIILLMNAESVFSFDMRWKSGLQFSLFGQFFFLLYGIAGNLLTDHMYILMYIFTASITLASIKHAKQNIHLKKLNYVKYVSKST